MIVKNTYGISVAFSTKQYGVIPKREFTGSALDRKKQEPITKLNAKKKESKDKERKERSLSPRSKQKIRKKITCFARCYKRLSFVTLTFLNKVSDEQAINLLRKFVDNAKKRSEDFQYVWVAERQTKNDVFEGNVHFHMITNKYWKIEKWWNYWIDLQLKNGIKPRDEDYKPSSAFDVKQLNSKNIRSIASYVTKYVTKNNAKFKCQVWNCSKRVSELYTDFYTTEEYTDQFKRMGAVLKEMEVKDHCNRTFLKVKMINLNRNTLPLYKRLDDKNNELLKYHN
ncbi:rolling circle replication-associated protein [Algibacter aquimarinus]|uniref:Replication-associated protein ORF2/G2P domain-containing protein n=1 Tax=Algibacter aquimarinus TaxID=1136748 RepID=A0ABP9HDB3_9FLAO